MSDGYVLVIGAAGIDTKGYASATLESGTSNPGKIKSSSGGVARNISENLSRLGQTVMLLSAVGNDPSGERVIKQLQKAGIDTADLLVVDNRRTAAYLALYDENKALIHSIDDMSVLDAISAQYVYRQRALIHNADMVVMDGNLSVAVIASVIKQATAKKVPIVVDPTSVSLADKIIPHLANLYMVTPNAAEAEVLTGQRVKTRGQAIKAAHELVALGVDIAVVTLGEKGVVYATSDTSGHIPALSANVVDMTGASDAMSAAIIFAILNDFPVDEAVRLGAGAAFLTLQTEDSVVPDMTLDLLYNI